MRSKIFHNRRLALILILYLILAISFSLVTPIGRGADEWAHYWYAQFIAHHGRLPANPAERETAGYKSDWPPLYHLFAAAATAWIETDGPPTFKYRADNLRRQLVPALGPEAILHTEDERFPWRQEILVWHIGRFLSIGFTLGVLLVAYFIARDVFSSLTARLAGRMDQPRPVLSPQTLALAAVAVLAFNPRFLFTGMLFNYDSLTLLLSSLFLWLTLRVANDYHSGWGFGGLGALAGLALVTKYLTVLLPVMIVILALRKGTEPPQQTRAAGKVVEEAAQKYSAVARYLPRLPHLSRLTYFRLGLAMLAFILVVSPWFVYLLLNFNEIETYGPVLGVLAPLIRGDGSDRTVEELFAWLSGGQGPAPAHLDRQDYTPWQILAEFPTTFWGNPITRPYPLNGFIIIMTLVSVTAAIGLWRAWRSAAPSSSSRRLIFLLGFYSALPLPLIAIRLFGARDALEAVQGRHVLFLAGPAVAILLVWGLSVIISYALRFRLPAAGRGHASYVMFHILSGLLLTGAISQLIFMRHVYPPLLPVQTRPYQAMQTTPLLPNITLPGGAKLTHFNVTRSAPPDLLTPAGPALQVTLIWQAGPTPAPEDYQVELALLDSAGQIRANWLAYQTQAHYPTRAWEAGDIVRDEGWLPLAGVGPGEYEIRMRLLGEHAPVAAWRTLSSYSLSRSKIRGVRHASRQMPNGAASEDAGSSKLDLPRLNDTAPQTSQDAWLLWRQGQIAPHPPTLHERETAQLTWREATAAPSGADHHPASAHLLILIGPDGISRAPGAAGPTWANFIIAPDWPPGDYRLEQGRVLFRVAQNKRNFQLPAISHRLEVSFEGQLKLLGYDLPARRVQPGQGLPLTLYWQAEQWPAENFVIFNRLLDNPQDNRQPTAWGGYDRLPQENYSTLLWAPGEIVTDGFAVPVAADAPDGIYTLSLGLYRQVGGQANSLAILDPESGQPTGAANVTIGPLKVGGAPPGATIVEASPQTEVNVMLGEAIKLLGFDLANRQTNKSAKQGSGQGEATANDPLSLTTSPPGRPTASSLDLTFYWQTLNIPETDYTVFVHVRNDAGQIVAQQDRPPLGGAYPTGLWERGEIIKDELSLALEQLEPGQYELVAGMYDFVTGVRLPVEGSSDGTIWLQSLEVTP